MNRKSIVAAATFGVSLWAFALFADQAQPQPSAGTPPADQGQPTAAADTKTPQDAPAPNAAPAKKPQDGKSQMIETPITSSIKDLKGQQDVLKKLVEDFKANPTEDGKAKIITQVGVNFDHVIKIREMRLESEKDSIDKMKKERDLFIYKTVESLLAAKPSSAAKADADKDKSPAKTAKPEEPAAKQGSESSATAGK